MKKVFLMLACAVLACACMQLPGLPEVPQMGEFQLPVAHNRDGEKLEVWDTNDYKGKPVLVVFMGSWCPYCKMSMPLVDEAAQAYEGKVKVVAAFVDEDKDAVAEVVKQHELKVTALYDAGEISQEMEVSGFPHAVLFNKDHYAVKVWEGFKPTLGEEFKAQFERVTK